MVIVINPSFNIKQTSSSSSYFYKTHEHGSNWTLRYSLYFTNVRESKMIWVPKVKNLSE